MLPRILPLLIAPPLALASSSSSSSSSRFPLVVNTWGPPFTVATNAAFLALANSSSSSSSSAALDAVQSGCAACESARCDRTVGFGGSPDENCETTLDALIIDGRTLNVGAVAGLRRVKAAITVARHVLEYTAHSLLVGDLATQYALRHGLVEEDLATGESAAACEQWKRRGCVPNFRAGPLPDPVAACEHPSSSTDYRPSSPPAPTDASLPDDQDPAAVNSRLRPHDTLSLIAIDARGSIAAGTTTNGASHKIPGRAGDAPIPGSGAYADSSAGACGATGDGDIMMRFLPCYQAVESMRRGMTPLDAATDAVARMAARYPGVRAGLVVVSKHGEHAGAACGWDGFRYSWRAGAMEAPEVVRVEALDRRTDGGREEL